MPVVSEEHRAAQRARIHAATLEVLRAKGLSRLAMSDIITASGMSAGAIYGYFKGKDDLVYSLAEAVIGGRLGVLRDAAEERPVPEPDETYRRLFEGLPPGFVADGVILQIWAEAVSNERIRELASHALDDFYAVVCNYCTVWLSVQRGVPELEARRLASATAPALVALAQGFIVQGALRDHLASDTFAASIRALAQALVAGAS